MRVDWTKIEGWYKSKWGVQSMSTAIGVRVFSLFFF
ncbi:uncharacterized protein CCOS01_11673 [Colletotrichum costaricense]|uniref:Uncharacterized protein n=1 Tax=Colletotrichum costaricense TaxID=1209916 RepID=A0AAI9YPF2_9PEZI|nr:uncharacterized protein CCOS01_11673 [Colletotrichum costaricense]KAK1518853.1 hypothetical protein CCOS01_11673 [Colletotrichum costaricense]